MLTKCGCAIYVHLQLDLLKFYLAILKSHPLVSVSRGLACIVPSDAFVIMKCKWGLILSACEMNHVFIKYSGRPGWTTSSEREHMLRLEVQRQSGGCDGGMWQTGLSGAYSSASLTYILPDCYSPQWVGESLKWPSQQKWWGFCSKMSLWKSCSCKLSWFVI